VGRPDEGTVRVTGRIGALLDLGASFHPDLTGRENVFISAIAAGLTRREVDRRFDAIVEFAEVPTFIDNPLRTYSSGMQMRLAFSTAIHTYPDVLLIDEFLSVGDLRFQSKCLDRIATLKANGCAIVLISQNAKQIQQFCDQALWLKHGRIVAQGEPDLVAGEYAAHMEDSTLAQPTRACSGEIEIKRVRVLDRHHQPTAQISSGDPLTVEIEYFVHQPPSNPIFSVSLSYEDGRIYLNAHTANARVSPSLAPGRGRISLHLERLDLTSGQYHVNIGIYTSDWSGTHDYHWNRYPLQIGWSPIAGSMLCPPHSWEVAPPLAAADRLLHRPGD